MTYRVEFAESAIADADEIYRYIEARAPLAAKRRKTRLHRALDSLSAMPNRCPLAPENRHFDEPVRQKRLGRYRILFIVHSRIVYVLHVRHGARRPLVTIERLD